MPRVPRRDPVEPGNDDDSESWQHDDKAERSPRQRRQAEQNAFDANQLWLYRTMRGQYDVIENDWRHPWKDES